MDIQLIDESLLSALRSQSKTSKRRRQSFDLRNAENDNSQRMLNVLEVGTHVPIHRHRKTSESVICLEGCMEWVFYEELPSMDAGCITHDGETVLDENSFREIGRVRICPKEKKYGIQVPKMTWHSIVVHEPTIIFEAKDGRYSK